MCKTILVWCQDDVDGLEEDAQVLHPPSEHRIWLIININPNQKTCSCSNPDYPNYQKIRWHVLCNFICKKKLNRGVGRALEMNFKPDKAHSNE